MLVSENRYLHDLRRLELAGRLIEHEVRTHWICAVTGLTPNQVRNLLRSCSHVSVRQRHRGAAPTSCSVFFRQPLRAEAAALAGLAKVFRLVPARPVRNGRMALPDIEWGERLCKAFDLFRVVVQGSAASMDQFILLVMALADGRLRVGCCTHCEATIVTDPLAVRPPVCDLCRHHPKRAPERPSAGPWTTPEFEEYGRPSAPAGDQQTLFGSEGVALTRR